MGKPELAADLRRRKVSALYWLERLLGFTLFFAALGAYFFWLDRWIPEGEVYDMAVVGLIAMVWALADNQIRERYGRRKRTREIIQEIEEDLARPHLRQFPHYRRGGALPHLGLSGWKRGCGPDLGRAPKFPFQLERRATLIPS